MATYSYICPKAAEPEIVRRPMSYDGLIMCDCGQTMKRIYTAPRISWGGLPPSAGDLPPAIQRHLQAAPVNQERIQAQARGERWTP